MRVRALVVLLAVAVLGAACGDDSWVSRPEPSTGPGTIAFAATTTVPPTTTVALASGMDAEWATMEAARATWDQLSSDTYRYVIEWACLCEDARAAILVSIQQDTVTSALEFGPVEAAVARGSVTVASGDTIEGPTVDWLFDTIADALANGQRVGAMYDPTTGVPTVVDLDLDAIGPEIRTRNFSDITQGRTELIDAQTRWDESGISAYRWTYGVITLDGPQEVSASVANGVGDTGLSVEAVYALIAEAHVNPDRTVTATYDVELGLPLQVVIEQPMSTDTLPFTFTGVVSLEPS